MGPSSTQTSQASGPDDTSAARRERGQDTLVPPATREGAKETIESIIVAFILAFVFRAFVVEAFVIPTGSMAPTLYGKHGTMICDSCGWEYAYGLLADGGRIGRNSTSTCPNCGNPNTTAEFFDATRPPSLESGDRILVLKWPFDIGGPLLGPQRWQVVVFKNPRDGEENFIKRLVGLPDDVLEIIDGDVYVVPWDELSPDAQQTMEAGRRLKYLLRHKAELQRRRVGGATPRASPARFEQLSAMRTEIEGLANVYDDGRESLLAELDTVLQITRKSKAAQDVLWHVVCDADYPFPANDPPKESRQWKHTQNPANSNWELRGRWFAFRGLDAEEEAIQLTGRRVDDFSGYNVQGSDAHRGGGSVRPGVSDLRIRCVATRRDGDGFVRFSLSKRNRTFWGTVHANGRVTLHGGKGRRLQDAELMVEGLVSPLALDRPVEMAFEDVDYQLSLSVAGETALSKCWLSGQKENGQRVPDEQAAYMATVEEIRHRGAGGAVFPPAISAADIELDLTHLAVERDVFYTSPTLDLPEYRQYKLGGWGTMGNPIHLRDGEYFVLGDNSPQSADSRLWNVVGSHLQERGEAYQMGTVPEDQLIGRAFFVYWPSGLRTDLIPGPFQRIGWIPNVGRMRWIR